MMVRRRKPEMIRFENQIAERIITIQTEIRNPGIEKVFDILY